MNDAFHIVILCIVLEFVQYLSLYLSTLSIVQYLVNYSSVYSWVILYHIYNKYAKRLLNMYLLLAIFVIYLCVRYFLLAFGIFGCFNVSLYLVAIHFRIYVYIAAICDNNSCNNCTFTQIFASAYVSDAIEIHRLMIHHS